MIFSAVVVVSVLSLLTSSRALALNARQSDCELACPDTDADGNGLSVFIIDDATISCSYDGEPGNSCTYDTTSGAIIGDSDGCIGEAVQQCLRRSRQLKQAVARRGVYDGLVNKRGSAPKSWPSPSPSPTGKFMPQPPKQKQVDYKCPQKDQAKNPLTEEAVQDSYLLCNYSSPDCKCKYSSKTGLLLEDNDDGKCPQTAAPASSHPKRDAPSPSWDKGSKPWSNSKPRPSPSPSPTWKPRPQSPKQKQRDYECPQKDQAKNPLTDEDIQDSYLLCSYSSPDCKCKYSTKTGLLLEDNDDGKCPQTASPASSHSKRAVIPPTGSDSWSNPKSWPSPSPTRKPEPQPPKQKQCDYRCPQKDLAKNPLTDEAIRDGLLFCSYSSPECKSCYFCKYSAKTGLLLEDNDDGNCPQTATPVRPWDRRYI